MFLEGNQTPEGTASQASSEGITDGGGGRRASVTSMESVTSICSMGQLGNTISNSEWEESYIGLLVVQSSVVDYLRFAGFPSTLVDLKFLCQC